MRSPERIAGRRKIAIRRHLEQEERARPGHGRESEAPQGAGERRAPDRPADAESRDRHQHERQVLEVDGHRQCRDPAGPAGAGRPPVGIRNAAHRQRGQDHEQHDLRGMVVDVAGDEDAHGLETTGGQQRHGQHAPAAEETAAKPGQRRREHDETRDGLEQADHPLGGVEPEQRPEQRDTGRERQVGQPRPVHRDPVTWRHAVLDHIEPALPGQEIPHLDGPHGVVRIEEDPGPPDHEGLHAGQGQDETAAEQHGDRQAQRRKHRRHGRGSSGTSGLCGDRHRFLPGPRLSASA